MSRLLSMPTARRWVGRLVVICAGVNASSPFAPPSGALGNKNPDPSARADCMYSAACRYSTTATTTQNSWHSYVLPYSTAAWEERHTVVSNRNLKVNPSPPVICTTCDATTTCCQLLSPASEPYLDRAHSVAHVPLMEQSILVVEVPEAGCL